MPPRKTTSSAKAKSRAITKKRGPIPVAQAGDLPSNALVVSLEFAKKHWGKGALGAGALVGAGAVMNQAFKNANARKSASYAPAGPPNSPQMPKNEDLVGWGD